MAGFIPHGKADIDGLRGDARLESVPRVEAATSDQLSGSGLYCLMRV